MKKRSVFAMALMLGFTSSASFPAQAASVYSVKGTTQSKNCVVVKSQVGSLPEIKSVLEELCSQLQSGSLKDCPVITLPDCNQPGNESQPDLPDSSLPEEEQPETGTPEQDTPDENIPGEDVPDENVPDSETPDYDQSGGNTSQPEIPDTNLPDNGQLSYAEQVVKLVNEERAKAGLHALQIDTEVASAALVRAKEIQTSFSHTRPDGRKFSSVLTDANIRFTGAGENIAWGQTSPEKVMEAWMNSGGHRANILNAKFTKIGVGHLQNAAGTNYWVQLFTY